MSLAIMSIVETHHEWTGGFTRKVLQSRFEYEYTFR